ncbi:MAG: N-acetyl sugar amidotransferase [Saprospiraceae bacterium]|nr:N-acetyl sugar amidotransferase [Saprospiraceae bacterium]
MKEKEIYDQKVLQEDRAANCGRSYQQCSLSVMDTIADPNIFFDDDGICNYYHEYKIAEAHEVFSGHEGEKRLTYDLAKVKASGRGKSYDCILGLSGGVDSTFLCLMAREWGLNPLIVHFDNGWNSELAQHNIEQTVNALGFDLYTYVVDWKEFREMQLAYLKASVVDIEVLTDHAFMAVLYQQARKWKIRYVLAGMNVVTEHVLPRHWIYNKSDAVNIKDIVNRFGRTRVRDLKTYPFLDHKTRKYCEDYLMMEVLTPLNYIDYRYDEVKEKIKQVLNWRDYGGKHHESLWTRFYQGYILPRKFNIDKRKAHLSNLIFSRQLSKEEALSELKQPFYRDHQLMKEDYDFVCKKLGLTESEFQELMDLPRREHTDYETQKGFFQKYPAFRPLKPILDLIGI